MKARDLAKIVPVACDIAKAIFQLEKESLRTLSGINKLTSKAALRIDPLFLMTDSATA
jgi:hypothetical protein